LATDIYIDKGLMIMQHINYTIPKEWAAYHAVLRNAIMRLVSVVQSRLKSEEIKVLDVGCGRGELMSDLKRLNILPSGIDMDEKCVKMSSQYGNTVIGDISKIPEHYENECFDLVVASHILEHLDNPRQGVEFLKAATKKYLIIAVPNLTQFVNLSWRKKKTPGFVNKGHQVGWDPAHLHTFLVHTCGLDVLCWQPDRVLLHSRFRKPAKLLGIEKHLQDKILPGLFPLQSRSLIVLCAKQHPHNLI
jgi:2-polyprenyl-3-methyl-5-hydroxy-6-metoxy-1,4-benzoquinol methylase